MSNRAVSLGIACPGKLAHTAPNGATECLDAHARDVACRARGFATKFGAGALGCAAGLLHDLGKAKPGFQAYLRGERSSVPHSAEGALFAQTHYARQCPAPFEAPLGRLLAFAIAGHHAGLANGTAFGGGTLPLDERLAQAEEVTPWFALGDLPLPDRPPEPLLAAKYDPFGWAFFTRMLFSALVDADFLETERWFAQATGAPHRPRMARVPHGSQGRITITALYVATGRIAGISGIAGGLLRAGGGDTVGVFSFLPDSWSAPGDGTGRRSARRHRRQGRRGLLAGASWRSWPSAARA